MHEKEIKKMHKSKDTEISGIVEKYQKKVSTHVWIPYIY